MRARWHRRISELSAPAWDTLAGANPFTRHAFLDGLETSGSLCEELGWMPHHLGLWDGDTLIAAAPAYRKTNSHGEFVFDFALADAHERALGPYYPKLLVAVPYSPVTGPRLIGHAHAEVLQRALIDECRQQRWSSVHVNFLDADAASQVNADWLPREDVQFHFIQRGYRDFSDVLDAMDAKKRKNIRQERQRVVRAGIHCEWRLGRDIDATHIDLIHALYQRTFACKGNTAALTLLFFQHLLRSQPDQCAAVFARRGDEAIAMAFFLHDHERLYGRYWGAFEEVPGLHFEACYYQGIEFCLRRGFKIFEPGAQGEHKIARGFEPVRTHSRHYFRHPGMQQAAARWFAEERKHVAAYHQAVRAHSPFRAGVDDTDPSN